MSFRGQAFGRMARDPELRTVGAKDTVLCKGCVACDFGYKDNKGTTFMDFVAFGRTAEVIAERMPKGEVVLLRGEVQQENWDDKETGKKRSKHKLKVDGFTFVPGQKKREQAEPTQSDAPATDPGSVPF